MLFREQVTRELRLLLDQGVAQSDAIRQLHADRGIELLWLVEAVVRVTGMERRKAHRLVIGASGRV